MTRQKTNAWIKAIGEEMCPLDDAPTPEECLDEMTRIAQETGQYDDPPADMPPVPEGAVLDGQLKDHDGDVYGYIWAVGDSKWTGICNWGGMKGHEGKSAMWWFARVVDPTDEAEEPPNVITIKADHFEVETKDGELTVRWW